MGKIWGIVLPGSGAGHGPCPGRCTSSGAGCTFVYGRVQAIHKKKKTEKFFMGISEKEEKMMLSWLDKHFEHMLLAVLLVVLTVLSFMNVILRYAFQMGLSWSDEVCKYALVLSGFISVPCWIRYGQGIRVDAIVGMLPQKIKGVLLYVTDVLMVGFLGFMARGAVDMARSCAQINQKSPALQLPMAWLYGIIAFTFVLAIVRYVQIILLKHKPIEEGGEE